MLEWLTGLKVLGKIPGLASFLGPIIKRRLFRQIAVDIASLSFWNDGMRVTIEKIALGRGTKDDLNKLSEQLEQTRPAVDKAVKRLKVARNTKISTELGLGVARDLDDVIYQKVGPGNIRPDIEVLVKKGKVDEKGQLDQESQERASEILQKIEKFTDPVNRVHEEIRKKAVGVARSEPAKRHSKGRPSRQSKSKT